jgi:hypothetical protein
MIEKIIEFRSRFQKEVGCTPQSDMVAYIAWLEVTLYESEKNNAKPPVMESVCSCSKGKGIDHDENGNELNLK